MSLLLNGFGFSGYRSFGDDLVKIAPLKKVNLIIGQNNSGKSNIISFLSKHYHNVKVQSSKSSYAFTDADKHLFQKNPKYRISYPYTLSEVRDCIERKSQRSNHIIQMALEVMKAPSFFDGQFVWLTYSVDPNMKYSLEVDFNKLHEEIVGVDWYVLWNALTGSRGGAIFQHWIPETIHALTQLDVKTPSFQLISAIRKVGGPDTQPTDYSGVGLIDRMAKIQNPAFQDQVLKRKFEKINEFTRQVLENDSAIIEIPYDRNMIVVHMDGKSLPIDQLGTGVHEVIIIAAAATLLEDTVLCIEEPELHLHPLLQKKLVKYLFEKTNNQYFFTTHSAHLLDAVESEIFHVTYADGVSTVDAISSTKKKSSICNDLGYRASDILQANCIIWVEGPSDRIYLNFWIAQIAPELVEGIHYSIMFYGGKLFSHLTALDDDEQQEVIEDFISIRNLNRNVAIVFDSDKGSSGAKLSKTKNRLKTEFETSGGFCWITEGREIENYLNPITVEEAVKTIHPSAKSIIGYSKWDNLLNYKVSRASKVRTASKVKVARYVTQNSKVDLTVLNLNSRIAKLVGFIRGANGMLGRN